jgi:hypothetical protein
LNDFAFQEFVERFGFHLVQIGRILIDFGFADGSANFGGLLGSRTTNIDPDSVVVLAAPLNDSSSLVPLTANNGEFDASFVGQACPGCGYPPESLSTTIIIRTLF